MKEGTIAALRGNELLSSLSQGTLEKIAEVAVQRSYCGGATIFREGDAPDSGLFGVISGQVQITATNAEGQDIILYYIDPGVAFGLNSMIDGSARCASAYAVVRTAVFIIGRENFLRLLARSPEFALNLIRVLCHRQRLAARMVVEEYSANTVAVRLASRLLKLTRVNGHESEVEEGLVITQGDLARCVFVSRQAVNHCLQDWQWRGFIAASRGRLVIRNRKALEEIARSGDQRRDVAALESLGIALPERKRKGAPGKSVRF